MTMQVTGKSCEVDKAKVDGKVYKLTYSQHIDNDADELDDNSENSLQSAFLTFKRNRIDKLRRDRTVPRPVTYDEKAELRNTFLSKLFTYIGTPYAKRFHKPECVHFGSKLFLDCCGLVRRVLRDLSYNFGFTIGPWNQAYLYDTLPIKLSNTEQMRPGDLVFVSATYFDPKRKRQIHNIVHVEVWLGNGAKTIGSRWFKGTVQVFDSYKFISKSYYDMKYHFSSIETWLEGVCLSFCPAHKWLKHKYSPQRHSIFRIEDEAETSQQESNNL